MYWNLYQVWPVSRLHTPRILWRKKSRLFDWGFNQLGNDVIENILWSRNSSFLQIIQNFFFMNFLSPGWRHSLCFSCSTLHWMQSTWDQTWPPSWRHGETHTSKSTRYGKTHPSYYTRYGETHTLYYMRYGMKIHFGLPLLSLGSSLLSFNVDLQRTLLGQEWKPIFSSQHKLLFLMKYTRSWSVVWAES